MFHESHLHNSNTLLMDINYYFTFHTESRVFVWNTVYKLFTWFHWAVTSLRKIGSVAVTLNLNTQMNFDPDIPYFDPDVPYFDPDIPYFFPDFSEIWYTTSPRIAAGELWVLQKSLQWKPCFTYEHNWICTYNFHIFHI